jgi:hypothetical protein
MRLEKHASHRCWESTYAKLHSQDLSRSHTRKKFPLCRPPTPSCQKQNSLHSTPEHSHCKRVPRASPQYLYIVVLPPANSSVGEPISSQPIPRRFFSPPDSPRFFLSPTRVSATLVKPRRLIRLSTTSSCSSAVLLGPMRRRAAIIRVSLESGRDTLSGC